MTTRRKQFVLRDPAQVAVLASPVRCQLAECLSIHGPMSVREVAQRIERTPESLYYHVKALVDVGLVLLDSSSKVNRRREAVYRLVAPRLVRDGRQRSPAYKEALARTGEAFLRLAAREHRVAVVSGEVPAEGPRRSLSLRRHSARLDPAGLAKLNRLLDNVFDLLDQYDDPKSELPIAVTIAVAPADMRSQ